jgi:acyl carrier protein
MPRDDVLDKVSTALRAALPRELPESLLREYSLVADLGIDSMSMAMLGLALEDEFHCPILLNDWIAQHGNPESLTVGSLCDYLDAVAA